MYRHYLRAFVIGSCCFVFLPYFYLVSGFKPSKFNFDYKLYTFLAPVALGCMNVASLMMAETFSLSTNRRFLYAGFIAPTIVLATTFYFQTYNYTTIREWVKHIIFLYLLYFITFNYVLFYLEQYV
jgi:hypothetical protein